MLQVDGLVEVSCEEFHPRRPRHWFVSSEFSFCQQRIVHWGHGREGSLKQQHLLLAGALALEQDLVFVVL